MKKLLLLIMLLVSVAAGAVDAKFNKIWLEHNVMHDGVQSLAIHCDVRIHGYKGREVNFVAYVNSPKGIGHNDTNGRYRTTNGKVSTSIKGRCTYEYSRWDDLVIYLPNDEIHPKPGKNTYYICVYAWDDNSNSLATSDYVSFSMEGSSERPSYNNGGGSHRHDNDDDDEYNTCAVCKGSGIINCLLCGGTGGTTQWRCMTVPPYSAYSVWVNCMGCAGNRTVMCNWCFGKGKYKKSKVQNNGGGGSGNYNGNYNGGYSGGYSGGGSSGGSSSSGSSGSKSAYTTCRTCHGSGTCTSCRGSGGEWRWVMDEKKWFDCPSCHGSRRCFNCYGTGRI